MSRKFKAFESIDIGASTGSAGRLRRRLVEIEASKLDPMGKFIARFHALMEDAKNEPWLQEIVGGGAQ